MNPRPANDDSIYDGLTTLLGIVPITLAGLAERLEGDGLHLGPQPTRRLQDLLDGDTTFIETARGWVSALALVDGTSWCTEIDAIDAGANMVSIEPDLSALGWLSMDHELVIVGPDGEEMGILGDGLDGTVFVGPPGWLAHVAGQLASFRLDGDVVKVRASAPEPVPTAAMIDAIRNSFHTEVSESVERFEKAEQVNPGLEHCSIEDLVWEALVHDPLAFRSGEIPRLDTLLTAAGFERQDDTVARAGFAWVELRRWRTRNRLRDLYKVPDDRLELAEVAVRVGTLAAAGHPHPFGPTDSEPHAVLCAQALTDPDVAQGIASELRFRELSDDDLLVYADLVRDNTKERDHAGPDWLAGVALDNLGRPAEAEAALRRAASGGHPLALLHLAAFEADRGDALAAWAALRESGVDLEHEPLALEVGGYANHRPKASVGRNDPCPCGSGRKYKTCHSGKETISLLDRGPWLYAKAQRFLNDRDADYLRSGLVNIVADASGRGHAFASEFAQGKMLDDIALCEGEMFEDFLAQRSAVLPADEALTAGQWALTDRSVFEVIEARRDEIVLRDIRNGETVTVTNTTPGDKTLPGMYLLGRPLPIDNTWRAYSGFILLPPVMLDYANEVLDEADPDEVAALIGSTFAPPQMLNTDREPISVHEITWDIDDAKAAATALRAAGLKRDGDTFSLIRDSKNNPNTVIASVELQDDQIVASVNSDARADEILQLVARVLPDAELVSDDVLDMNEMFERRREQREFANPDLSNPDLRAALEAISRQFEQRWLDETIPALRGMTPRAAANDPIGRIELERLLNTFPPGDEPGAMNATRLRQDLGL
jgi:SEC-C motif